jgi:hypothetical protein
MKVLSSTILSFMFIVFWSCSDSGEPKLEGCTNSDACNYNGDATDDDGSCEDLDDCGECGGDSSTCNISFSETIHPIFTINCADCHGGSGGLTLTSYSELMGNDVVSSGNSTASKLIQRLRGTLGTQMPKNQDPLDEATINLIETWINGGALDN